MIISYFASGANLGYSLYAPLLLFTTHRCMICLKYALLTKSELARFFNCTVESILDEYCDQMMMNTALLKNIPEVVQFEIASAAAKTGVLLHQLYFHVSKVIETTSTDSQAINWKRLAVYKKCLSKCREITDGSFIITVSGVCFGLVTLAQYFVVENAFNEIVLKFIIVFIHSAIPFLVKSQPNHHNVATIIFYTSSTIINIIMYGLLLGFFMKSISAAKRAATVAENLGVMIRPSETCLTQNLITTRLEGGEPPNKDSITKMGESFREDDSLYVPDNIDGGFQLNELHLSKDNNTNIYSRKSSSAIPPNNIDNNKNDEWSLPIDSEQNTVVGGTKNNGEIRIRSTTDAVEAMRIKGIKPKIPRVTFHRASNVFAWLNTRLIMQNYGKRIGKRVDIYVGAFTILLAGNMLFIVLTLTVHQHSSGSETLAHSAYFAQMCFMVFTVGIVIMKLVIEKANINDGYGDHG